MKLKEIATLADVSITTVSRVLNNKGGVSKKNRNAVEEVLLKANIFINKEKKFSSFENKKIALVLPDLKNPFFGEIAKETSANLREHGYQTLIFDTDENFETESMIVDSILKNNEILGVIICISDGNKSLINIEKLKSNFCPVVMIDRELEFYQDGVFMDDFKAGYLATEALIKEGHSKIGIIVGPLSLRNVQNRLLGYKYALEKNGIKFDENKIFHSSLLLNEGYSVLEKSLINTPAISAIVTTNNAMTIGALQFLNRNKHLKTSLSLVGIGNFDYFNLFLNNISFVDWSITNMSEACVNLLIKKMSSQNSYTQKIIFEPTLILKGSEKFSI